MSTTVRVTVTTVAALALALTGSAHAQARAADSLVVSTEWLAKHLTDPSVVVVEVVHEPGARGVHIAGSRAVNYRSMTVSRDGLGTELPSPDSLKVLFEGLGISSASPRHLQWEALFETTNGLLLKDRATLRRMFADRAKASDVVVTYCWVGYRASATYFAARLLGLDAKFYDGSYQDWQLRKLPTKAGVTP